MYLSCLKNNEKVLFCKLANYLAITDGIVEAELKNLEQYNIEMGTMFSFQDKIDCSLSELLDDLKKMSDKTKKIIVFELIGLASSDEDYSSKEQEVINKICSEISFSIETKNKMEQIVKDLTKQYREIQSIVEE